MSVSNVLHDVLRTDRSVSCALFCDTLNASYAAFRADVRSCRVGFAQAAFKASFRTVRAFTIEVLNAP